MPKQHRHRLAYQTAEQNLAVIIAQETSGFIGAIPEQEDYDLAKDLVKIINERYES